jgi:hypothetical protein
MDSMVRASPWFMLVGVLLEWQPLTILVMIHRLTLGGPPRQKAVENSVASLPSMPG